MSLSSKAFSNFVGAKSSTVHWCFGIKQAVVILYCCSFHILWAAATLLNTPSIFGCRTGDRISPALAVYIFKQVNSSAVLIRITHNIGSPCCQLNLKQAKLGTVFNYSFLSDFEKDLLKSKYQSYVLL